MNTNINLPTIIEFFDDESAENFRVMVQTIIPKIKFEFLDGHDYVFYTRKDKNYRTLLEERETEWAPDSPTDEVEAAYNVEAALDATVGA